MTEIPSPKEPFNIFGPLILSDGTPVILMRSVPQPDEEGHYQITYEDGFVPTRRYYKADGHHIRGEVPPLQNRPTSTSISFHEPKAFSQSEIMMLLEAENKRLREALGNVISDTMIDNILKEEKFQQQLWEIIRPLATLLGTEDRKARISEELWSELQRSLAVANSLYRPPANPHERPT